MTFVSFEVDVACIDETYGVTIFVRDPDLPEPDEDDIVPCYFLVFKGEAGKDADDVARAFGACHEEAMETVGLKGSVTQEQFDENLEASIELAGELMVRHNLEGIDVEAVDAGVLQALFGIGGDPEQDPSKLN